MLSKGIYRFNATNIKIAIEIEKSILKIYMDSWDVPGDPSAKTLHFHC